MAPLYLNLIGDLILKSFKFGQQVLGVVEHLGVNSNALAFNPLKHTRDVFLVLFLDSLLQETLHFLAVLEPLQLLGGTLDDILTHPHFNCAVYGCLQLVDVDLLQRKHAFQGVFTLVALDYHIAVGISLFNCLRQLALKGLALGANLLGMFCLELFAEDALLIP